MKVRVTEATRAIEFKLRDDRSLTKGFKDLSSQLLAALGGLIDLDSIEFSKQTD